MRISNLVILGLLAPLVMPAPAFAARKKPKVEAAPAAPVASVRAGVDLWRAGDHAAAVAMWTPFANAGDADAMFNIGQAYKLGRAVPKDLALARDWYRRAAFKGHLPAQANLGILLFQAGEKQEAIRWLRAAADRNEMRAQYVLGVANWNGDSIPRNLTLAYAYLSRAAAQGLPEGVSALAGLSTKVSAVERANGLAVASGLAGNTGVPAAFGGTGMPATFAGAAPPTASPTVPVPAAAPVATASADSARDQVIKPAPAAVQPAPVQTAQAGVQTAMVQQQPQQQPPQPQPAAAPRPATVPPQLLRPQAPPVRTVDIPPAAQAAATPPAQPAVVAAQPKPAPAPRPFAVAAAKPAAAAPKPVRKQPLEWRIQLGAFSKKALAEAAWDDVKAKQKQLVASNKPIFNSDGGVTKLQMGPFASREKARDACARIAFSGRACFVTEG